MPPCEPHPLPPSPYTERGRRDTRRQSPKARGEVLLQAGFKGDGGPFLTKSELLRLHVVGLGAEAA